MTYTTSRAASAGKPCCISVRRLKSDLEQWDRRSLTWRDTENFPLNVTQSILIFSTWVKPESVNDGTMALNRFLRLILFPLTWKDEFYLRLLLQAHVSILLISAEHDLTWGADMVWASNRGVQLFICVVKFTTFKNNTFRYFLVKTACVISASAVSSQNSRVADRQTTYYAMTIAEPNFAIPNFSMSLQRLAKMFVIENVMYLYIKYFTFVLCVIAFGCP